MERSDRTIGDTQKKKEVGKGFVISTSLGLKGKNRERERMRVVEMMKGSIDIDKL